MSAIIGTIVHSLSFGQLQIIEHGAILFNPSNGIISRVLDLATEHLDPSLNIIDRTGKLLMPGFIDAHCHAPQYVFTGTGVDMPLLQWLETYTFPTEAKFSNEEFASKAYEIAVKRHIKSGTTFASYFATIHKNTALELAKIILKLGQRAYIGKVSMDRNSPPFYVETTEDAIADAEHFITSMLALTAHGQQQLAAASGSATQDISAAAFPLLNTPTTPKVLPSITPRFVPTCTTPLMNALGDLSYKYSLPVQSHLSENKAEIEWVASLHPECCSYIDVYKQAKLLHFGSVMAHCVHPSSDEIGTLRDTNTAVIHCASSNFLLGSGMMDVRKFVDNGVVVGLGTDVAGGASASMLDAIRQTITASRAVGFAHRDFIPSTGAGSYNWLKTEEAFHLATVGSATALGMGNVLGNFLPNKKLDLLVVDIEASGGPIDIIEPISSYNKFEKFIYLGDDRNILEIYVDGVKLNFE